jgi:hypothetical protein
MERVGGGTATSLSGGDDTELGVEGLSGVAVTITDDRRWGGGIQCGGERCRRGGCRRRVSAWSESETEGRDVMPRVTRSDRHALG